MTTPTQDNTVQLTYADLTQGFPLIDDGALSAQLGIALQGGEPTGSFFDALNATSVFWSKIAGGLITFNNATDTQGTLVMTASSGDVDARVAASYSGATTLDAPFGTLAVEIANTSTKITQALGAQIRIASIPDSVPIGQELFDSLLPTILSSFVDILKSMAAQLAVATSVEDPSIQPNALMAPILAVASKKVIGLVGAAARLGLQKLIQDFNGLAFSLGAIAPLMAIPAILNALTHDMYLSVLVINRTGFDFTVRVDDQVHGSAAVTFASPSLSAQTATSGLPLGAGSGDTFSQMAVSQYINSTTMGSIGLVLGTTRDGGAPAAEIIAVPWAGKNTIWTGPPSANPSATYDAHASPNGQLSWRQDFDGFTVEMAINSLEGKTGGSYWYGVIVVLQPRS